MIEEWVLGTHPTYDLKTGLPTGRVNCWWVNGAGNVYQAGDLVPDGELEAAKKIAEMAARDRAAAEAAREAAQAAEREAADLARTLAARQAAERLAAAEAAERAAAERVTALELRGLSKIGGQVLGEFVGYLCFPPELGHDDTVPWGWEPPTRRPGDGPIVREPGKERERGKTGTVWGDPHVITFDGTTYDYQGVGEFTLFQSAALQMELVGRFVQIGEDVSIPDSAGLVINGQRLSIHPGTDQPLRVNGAPATSYAVVLEEGLQQWFDLGEGYSATYDGTTMVMETPLGIVKVGPALIEFTLWADVQVTDARGLLGNVNDDPDDDVNDAHGVPITSGVDLNVALGSWRIASERSPLHYGDGQSWETFQNFAFPPPAPPLPNPTRVMAAEVACIVVDDELSRERCVDDFARTGNPAIIEAAMIADDERPVAVAVVDEATDQIEFAPIAEETFAEPALEFEQPTVEQSDFDQSIELAWQEVTLWEEDVVEISETLWAEVE